MLQHRLHLSPVRTTHQLRPWTLPQRLRQAHRPRQRLVVVAAAAAALEERLEGREECIPHLHQARLAAAAVMLRHRASRGMHQRHLADYRKRLALAAVGTTGMPGGRGTKRVRQARDFFLLESLSENGPMGEHLRGSLRERKAYVCNVLHNGEPENFLLA